MIEMATHTESFSDPAAMDVDDASEQLAASTPPTSVGDDSSSTHEHAFGGGGRARRSRVTINYNVKELFDAQTAQEVSGATASKSRKASGLSGRTLVNHRVDTELDVFDNGDMNMELDDEMEENIVAVSPKVKGKAAATRVERRPSVLGRAKKAASVLGKRTRDVYEAGKKRLAAMEEPAEQKQRKLLKELDTGPGGILDDIDLDVSTPAPTPAPAPATAPASRPSKRTKPSAEPPTTRPSKAARMELAPSHVANPMQQTSGGLSVKKWQTGGLYVGQEPEADLSQPPKKRKLQKSRATAPAPAGPGESDAKPKTNHLGFGLPMFSYLDRERSFTIPYDIFAPNMDPAMAEKPPKFTLVTNNRAIGDAKAFWKNKNQDYVSYCTCLPETGCDESCLNAVMGYECDESNCRLEPDNCSNRPFSELERRRTKGGRYDIGVEVVKTKNRGHGVRAARPFQPGQLIMEYTGEIITEDECQERMATTYLNATNYFVMEMENGLILDGNKGSEARFINHSCDPNCEVKMTRVGQVSRLGVYAGPAGIMTGQELTYDYNFQNFSDHRQACYCGGQHCRGYLGKRLPESEIKKLNKKEQARLRKLAEEAQQRAQVEAAKKQAQIARGPSWRGWCLWEEAEAELAEKARKQQEAALTSDRALRMAKRKGDSSANLPAAPSPSVPASQSARSSRKKATSGRKKIILADQNTKDPADDEDESDEDLKTEVVKNLSRSGPKRFQLPDRREVDVEHRPASKLSSRPSSRRRGTTSIHKKTTVSVEKSMDTQRADEVQSGEDTGSDIVVAAPSSLAVELTSSNGTNLTKISSQGKQKQTTGGATTEEDEQIDGEQAAKTDKLPKHSQSMRDRVKQVLSSVSSGKMKSLKQSTLNFAKRS